MKTYVRTVSTLALCLVSSSWLLAQQAATPHSILAGVIANLGTAKTQGITLSGNAEFIAGGTDDTGLFTASCSVSGLSRLQLQLSSGSRTEVRQITDGTPTGQWVDSQGEQHSMAGHNLLTPESWFCPGIALSRFLQNSGLIIQFLGEESRSGATVEHFIITAAMPGTTPQGALIAHLTNADIFLDSATLRPVAFDFTVHPDNNANIDIPVEVRFSNYTNASGAWVPFTIEKYVNSTLALRLKVENASPSTTSSVNQ